MDDSLLNEPNSYSLPRQQVITEADNGKSISLENGETFYIRLYDCRADCGYYPLQLNVSRGLSVLSKDYIGDTCPEQPIPAGMTPWVGWSDILEWKIKAVAQGIQQVKGICTRGDYTNDTVISFTLRNDETIISSISVTDIVFDVYLEKWNYRAIPKVKTWSYFLTIP